MILKRVERGTREAAREEALIYKMLATSSLQAEKKFRDIFCS
jgi:hypothetical protein